MLKRILAAAALAFVLSTPAIAEDCVDPTGETGDIIYNADFDVYQGCTVRGWAEFHEHVASIPDPFSFTDETGAAASALIESGIVQITANDPGSNLSAGAGVSVSGDGAPEFRVCTNGSSAANCDGSVVRAWGPGNGTIAPNQYLQVRLTSSGSDNTLHSAAVRVGTLTDQWDVTTGAGGPCAADLLDPADVGTVCAGGEIYAGDSPAGGDMYVTDVNQSTSIRWDNTNCFRCGDGTMATSLTDGKVNVAAMRAWVEGNTADGDLNGFDAARLCDDLDRHGKTDWYLPAKDELDVLYENKADIDAAASENFTTSYYWSSTEYNTHYAWRQYFYNGSQNYYRKSYYDAVRCVRRD